MSAASGGGPVTSAARLAGLLAALCPPRRVDLAGAATLPVAPAAELPHAAAFRAWLAAGRHAGLAYLARDPEARLDPRRQRPWARTVLAFAQRYADGWDAADRSPWDGAGAGRPWTDGVARYARGRDYHELLLADVRSVVAGLREELGPLRAHVAVDTGPYLEREHAWLAGLGFLGKNSCLIHERLGSALFLAVAVTDLAVSGLPPAGTPAGAPLWEAAPRGGADAPGSRCGSCRLCLDACPTGALAAPFVLDARRCLSTWTIEWRGQPPPGEEAAQGALLFGCDICQAVCPWNRRAAARAAAGSAAGAVEMAAPPAAAGPPPPPTSRAEYGVDPAHAELTLDGLASLDDAEFRRRFRRSPLWRAHPEGLRRNARIARANLARRGYHGPESPEGEAARRQPREDAP